MCIIIIDHKCAYRNYVCTCRQSEIYCQVPPSLLHTGTYIGLVAGLFRKLVVRHGPPVWIRYQVPGTENQVTTSWTAEQYQ